MTETDETTPTFEERAQDGNCLLTQFWVKGFVSSRLGGVVCGGYDECYPRRGMV